MIKFKRYPHANDLLEHYSSSMDRDDIKILLSQGLSSAADAELFSKFIWDVAGRINEDDENNIEVFGSTDNTLLIPDLSYEINI